MWETLNFETRGPFSNQQSGETCDTLYIYGTHKSEKYIYICSQTKINILARHEGASLCAFLVGAILNRGILTSAVTFWSDIFSSMEGLYGPLNFQIQNNRSESDSA